MKVFAEYIELPDGKRYRRKTLLKLGDSDELIGSAILINPGSAEPISDISIDDKNWLKNFYFKNHSLEVDNFSIWKEFTDDPTIRFLVKIFSGGYINKEINLNGVIQLFNCSYYKEQKLDEAKQYLLCSSDFIFNEYAFLVNKPVYFGWGGEGKNGSVSDIAKEIFSKYDCSLTPIYNEIFYENTFYHPMYVNRSYKRNKKTQQLLSAFYDQVIKVVK